MSARERSRGVALEAASGKDDDFELETKKMKRLNTLRRREYNVNTKISKYTVRFGAFLN